MFYLKPEEHNEVPDLILIGHIAKDLLPGGQHRLGGTVTYAAKTAVNLGLKVGVVTSASSEMIAEFKQLVPEASLVTIPHHFSTAFENIYEGETRTQYIRSVAATLDSSSVPEQWFKAPMAFLCPIAQEVDPSLATMFKNTVIAATPQGWLRSWDADGHVMPTPWEYSSIVLPSLTGLILSIEDLPTKDPLERETTLLEWAGQVPVMAVTKGAHGATLYFQQDRQDFQAYRTVEIDPTGAGDVFATAFLISLQKTKDAAQATNYACCVASFSVEGEGISAIPYPDQVEQRLKLP